MHPVASSQYQPWGILERDPVRLIPRLLPGNKPGNKTSQQILNSSARHFASVNLSLLICEIGMRAPSVYNCQWVVLSKDSAFIDIRGKLLGQASEAAWGRIVWLAPEEAGLKQ